MNYNYIPIFLHFEEEIIIYGSASASSIINTGGAFGIIALILSIVIVILAFIFIVPEKKRETLNKFGKFLHDTVNFKYLIVEKILQALYIFLTAYVIILGFLMLFYVEKGWYGDSHWLGGYGILLMIFGPIVIRLIYELIMMAIILVKNVISINNKLKNQNDGNFDANLFKTPDLSQFKRENNQPQPQPQYTQQPVVEQQSVPCCPNCGATVEGGQFCTKCGTKL